MRRITIELPDSLVERIERVEKISIEEFAEEKCRAHFDDARRTQVEIHNLGLSWHLDVYNAMLKKVGGHGIAPFVRQAIFDDMSRTDKGLIPPPEWKQAGRAEGKKRQKVKATPGRTSTIRHLALPMQWYERISEKHEHVGRYVKATAQLKLEKQLRKWFPVQRGLGEYISRD